MAPGGADGPPRKAPTPGRRPVSAAADSPTVTAVMLLVERGALALDDPVADIVPAFAENGKADEKKLAKALQEIFPLRPTNIRRSLKLNRPIYQRTAAYGHFGRAPEKDGGFSWERTDLVDALKRTVR